MENPFDEMRVRVEAYRAEVAALRDKGRDILGELEGLVDSLDSADDNMGWAVRHMEDATDAMSQLA